MPTVCSAYTTHDEASAAVARMLAEGTPGEEIRVLSGAPLPDHADAPAGAFADGGDEAVGAFAGAAHSPGEPMGGFAGEPSGQRTGGFGDIDRETVASYRDGVRHAHVASHHDLKAMLVDAGLDEQAAERDVDALHGGRVLVLVRTG